ncbi:hypothetical protein BN1007_70554 [Klebsiella variicola]|nr:hypothetical protein BN1007_70554 [Klebsiella variicola]
MLANSRSSDALGSGPLPRKICRARSLVMVDLAIIFFSIANRLIQLV